MATTGLIILPSEVSSRMAQSSGTGMETTGMNEGTNTEKRIIAKLHATDFGMSDNNFNSLTLIGDDLYYTLGSHDINTSAKLYRYNTVTGKIILVGDFGDITGEDASKKYITHGKSHGPLSKIGDKIYFSTHISFMLVGEDGRETSGIVPEGYTRYTGGKFIEYAPATGKFKVLFSLPVGEGNQTFAVDEKRALAYSFSWPSGTFWVYDIKAEKLIYKGKHQRNGEDGVGEQFSAVPRHIAIDPRDGAAYFTTSDGDIMEYRREIGEVTTLNWAHLRKDVFGTLDPRKGGHFGYHWRHMVWNEKRQIFYGIHGNSGYLFSFDPKGKKLEIVARIVSEHCLRNGLNPHFHYGNMTLGQKTGDDDTIYYIADFYKFENPTPEQALMMQQTGRPRGSKGAKVYLSLVTYHLPTGTYKDHGVIQMEDGRFPDLSHTIAIDKNGRIYTCPWLPRTDTLPSGCQLASFRVL